MKGITSEAGGFQKVVFESVIDTLAGGVTLDLTGFSNPDGVVPAGTLVGAKDPATGLAQPVVVTPGAPATFAPAPVGMVHYTVKAEDNCLVGVVIEGVARIDALPDAAAATAAADLAPLIPKITLV